MFNLSGKANEADAPTAQPQLAETEAKLADALAINEKFHDVSAEVEQTKQALCAAEEGRSIEILPVVGKLDLPEAGSSQHPRKQGRIDMNRRTVLRSIVGAAAFCPTCLSVASAFAGETAATTDHASGPPHWSYGGAEGPEHWGELSPAYRVCDLGV